MFCFKNITRNMLSQKPREAVYISIKTKGKQAKGKNVIKKQNKKLYKQKKVNNKVWIQRHRFHSRKSKVLTIKSRTETHFGQTNISLNLRLPAKWDALKNVFFYLDFRSYLFYVTVPNCFIVLCTYFCRRKSPPKAFLNRQNGRKNS